MRGTSTPDKVLREPVRGTKSDKEARRNNNRDQEQEENGAKSKKRLRSEAVEEEKYSCFQGTNSSYKL